MRVLEEHANSTGYLDVLLDQRLAKANLTPPDRSLIHELTHGVVRWQAALDYLIRGKAGDRPQKLRVQTLLRLGLYQLFWLDRNPDHGAVHETVELAKTLGCAAQAGFINAVLRNYLRERDVTAQRLNDLKSRQPAVGFSHPQWLYERWQARWGSAQTRALLDWNNNPPPTFARLNTLRADAAILQSQWEREKVVAEPRTWDWTGEGLVFELRSHPPLSELISFQHGWFYVQDPSTLLAVRELDPQPGEAILDLCAAPGGKTTYIAQLMKNQGSLLAHDPNPARRQLLHQNCERLGVACAAIAGETAISPRRAFDRVLIDAPCSNTGVMRRRVELRWRIRQEEMPRLTNTQAALLAQGAEWVKPNGTVVYSTCSLEPEENRCLVDQFLAAHPNFRLEHDRTLLPFVDGTDGAYVARLRRI